MIKTTIEKHWHGNEVKIQGRKVTGKTAYEIGLVVEGQAKLLAAKNYGLLAASINTQSNDKGTELEAPDKYKVNSDARNAFDENMARLTFKKIEKPDSDLEVLVGTHLEYAPYVEFGTTRSSAQPFLRPSLDLAQGKVLTIVKNNSKYEFKDYIK